MVYIPSSGVPRFCRNSDKSYDVEVNNLYTHDITHSSREEAYLLKSMRSVFHYQLLQDYG